MTTANEGRSPPLWVFFFFFFHDTRGDTRRWGNETRRRRSGGETRGVFVRERFVTAREGRRKRRPRGAAAPRWACGWKRSGQMICCPKSLSEFAEGGSEIIAIFHRETPVIASATPPNTTVVSSDAKLV